MTVRPARSQAVADAAASAGGTVGPRSAKAARRATSGTSLRTVSAVHVRAEMRIPDATKSARAVTRKVAPTLRAVEPSKPSDGTTAPVRPTITADVLRKALT